MKSINQSITPVNTRINEKGCLEIGGCDMVELAKEFGTPLYVVDEDTVREVCRQYKEAFSFCDHILFLYASKAFMTGAMVKIMEQEGFGLDLVSGGEIHTAHKNGFPMENTYFNGNNKSADEIDLALKSGVGRIGADNYDQLLLLEERARMLEIRPKVLLRVTPGIECHTHEYIRTGQTDSKFGFDISQLDDAIHFLKEKCEHLDFAGIHAHIGSQVFELEVYHDLVQILFQLANDIKKKTGIEMREINLGGGLGIKYTQGDHPPSIYEYASKIKAALKEANGSSQCVHPKILLEPGRSIAGTAGVTLYTVGSIKQVPYGPRYVSVDGGMADNPRPAMYQAKYHAVLANNAQGRQEQTVSISGKYCESGDVLIKKIRLPEPQGGDILCIFNTGAYNYSMASNYNRIPRLPAVLVKDGKADLIIKRETYEDLVKFDVIPERLRS